MTGDRFWGRRTIVLLNGDEVPDDELNAHEYAIIERELKALYEESTTKGEPFVVIHGKAPGADSIAGQIASLLADGSPVAVEPYPANWKRYGKAAGPVRNEQMLLIGKPDRVLAFHRDLSASKGTKNMVNQANLKRIPVKLVSG